MSGAAEGGDLSATPTLPTAWLLKASAADLNQRTCARLVSIKSHDENGAARGD